MSTLIEINNSTRSVLTVVDLVSLYTTYGQCIISEQRMWNRRVRKTACPRAGEKKVTDTRMISLRYRKNKTVDRFSKRVTARPTSRTNNEERRGGRRRVFFETLFWRREIVIGISCKKIAIFNCHFFVFLQFE